MPASSNWPVNSQLKWLRTNLGFRGARLTKAEWVHEARLAQYPLLPLQPAIWLVTGGRGAGKTRLGAEWVNALVHGLSPFTRRRYGRFALVGETLADVRDVMIEGPSGIATISRRERPRFEASRRRLVWESGAVAYMFSSEDRKACAAISSRRLVRRGRQVAPCRACFDMLQFACGRRAAPDRDDHAAPTS